ncbi:hypothetical protein BYT27DRAFT_7260748 [Phlegmacium glaucopus]|nr:hypothetical protein BYT27DRAFT_7260748 [Phlegmacium glaucopus]
MPPKGAQARTANLENLQKARDANLLKNPAASASASASANFESTVIQYQQQLADMEAQITSLEVELEKSHEQCSKFSELLENAQKYIEQLRSALERASKGKTVLKETVAELVEYKQKIMKEAKELQKDVLKSDNEHFQKELSGNSEHYAKELAYTCEQLKSSQSALKGSKSEVYNLKQKCARAIAVKENAVQKARSQVLLEKSTLYLLKKGVYSEQTRNLVRILVQAGVSAKNIMGVIKAVLGIAGITTVGNISPHTVAQIIREGYIAACIQLGFELDKTEAVTFGSDGTGHKNLNYNSRYAHYKVRDADGEQAQVTHFLGLQRSLDGSSEQAMRDWDDQLQKIFDIYNDSPLAKEQSSFTHLINVYSKLAGMHADHCAKEKKDYDLMGKKKTEAVHQVLGKRRIIDDTNEELMPFFLSAHKEMVEKAGGEAASDWNNLDESAQKEHKAAMLEKLTTYLGQDAFEKLSDKEKAIFKLFVWVEHRLEPPVLLPNKFNEAIIQEAAKEDKNDSEAAQRAVKNSSQGGIKATKLAGDILNNKNDKSGHHDQFRTWWETNVGKKFTFPDTSNTRFQSHCEAAAALTLHHDKFVEYLKYAKDKKQRAHYVLTSNGSDGSDHKQSYKEIGLSFDELKRIPREKSRGIILRV